MAINEFKIENLSNAKGLKFHSAQSVSDSLSVNNVSLPLAGQDTTKSFIRNFGGFVRIITVNFMLTNDGTDKSTDGSNIITLSQQRDYLNASGGVIQGVGAGDKQFDVKYRLTLYEDGATKTLIGSVEDLSFNNDVNEANIVRGSINFSEGGN